MDPRGHKWFVPVVGLGHAFTANMTGNLVLHQGLAWPLAIAFLAAAI